MKVFLAGYNVDADTLAEIKKAHPDIELTPETISAAYARISRDPRPIDELRKDARAEVAKARKSNSAIIFGMGHSSIAEHAVFNLDIIGVSRYLAEEIERFRLASFTEKSQRYITLEDDFVVPEELKNSPLEKEFIDTIKLQNRTYSKLYEKLKPHTFKKFAELAKDPKNENLLDGWAKEDARYIVSLATQTQLGLTANARTLEHMLCRFSSSPLKEVQDLGKKIYSQVDSLAPSVIKYTEPNPFEVETLPAIKEFAATLFKGSKNKENFAEVSLVNYSKDADDFLLATLLHHASSEPFSACSERVSSMNKADKEALIKESFRHIKSFDKVLREFEYINLTFEITLSSSCFAQLKRHRTATITTQDYNPELGVTIPESIKEIGLEKEFMAVIDKTNEIYKKILATNPLVAPYILTNSHRRRLLFQLNARELYHFSRLREDKHSQWDIRNVATQMVGEAKKIMPLTLMLVGSKEEFQEKKESLF